MIIPTKVLCTTGKPPKLLNSNANDQEMAIIMTGSPNILMLPHSDWWVDTEPWVSRYPIVKMWQLVQSRLIFSEYTLLNAWAQLHFISKCVGKAQRLPRTLCSEFWLLNLQRRRVWCPKDLIEELANVTLNVLREFPTRKISSPNGISNVLCLPDEQPEWMDFWLRLRK